MSFFKEPQSFVYGSLQKGRIGDPVSRGTELQFGSYGLRVLNEGKLGAQELEAISLILVSALQNQGRIWWRVQLSYPYTSKSVGVRMGNGKGSREGWQARVRQNQILVELEVPFTNLALFALGQVRYNLSLPVQIVTNHV